MSITYYVVVPFIRDDFGDLVAEQAIEATSIENALAKVRLLAPTKAGVLAFSRSGDPVLGEFLPAEILARVGETPDELE